MLIFPLVMSLFTPSGSPGPSPGWVLSLICPFSYQHRPALFWSVMEYPSQKGVEGSLYCLTSIRNAKPFFLVGQFVVNLIRKQEKGHSSLGEHMFYMQKALDTGRSHPEIWPDLSPICRWHSVLSCSGRLWKLWTGTWRQFWNECGLTSWQNGGASRKGKRSHPGSGLFQVLMGLHSP